MAVYELFPHRAYLPVLGAFGGRATRRSRGARSGLLLCLGVFLFRNGGSTRGSLVAAVHTVLPRVALEANRERNRIPSSAPGLGCHMDEPAPHQ